jgi:hypothetical protein
LTIIDHPTIAQSAQADEKRTHWIGSEAFGNFNCR